MTIDVGYAHLALPDGVGRRLRRRPGPRPPGRQHARRRRRDRRRAAGRRRGRRAERPDARAPRAARRARDRRRAGRRHEGRPGRRGRARPRSSRRSQALLATTTLAGIPVLVVSATTGEGIDDVRGAIGAAGGSRRRRGSSTEPGRDSRSTGSSRSRVVGRSSPAACGAAGSTPGATLRLRPRRRHGRASARSRCAARRCHASEAVGRRSCWAASTCEPRRGQVLTADPGVVATSRILVAIRGPGDAPAPADRERLRLHLGTDQVAALVVRGPREAVDLPDGAALAILRLDAEIAAAPGDRFALRRPSPGSVAGGGVVLDPRPPRGVSRRRMTADRAAALARPSVGAFARPARPPRGPAGWRRLAARHRTSRDRSVRGPSSSSPPTTPPNPTRSASRSPRFALSSPSPRAAS